MFNWIWRKFSGCNSRRKCPVCCALWQPALPAMHSFVSACFDLSHSVCAYITFGGWLLCKAVVSWVLRPPGYVPWLHVATDRSLWRMILWLPKHACSGCCAATFWLLCSNRLAYVGGNCSQTSLNGRRGFLFLNGRHSIRFLSYFLIVFYNFHIQPVLDVFRKWLS